MLIELGQRPATTCAPAQNATDHVEATPRAKPNESLLKGTRGVALHKPSVRPRPEMLEQPAVQVCFNFHLPMPPLKTETQEDYAEPITCRSAQILGKTSPLGMVRRAA